MTTEAPSKLYEAVLAEAITGLDNTQKTLSPWLFYDQRGSQLFEEITALPEYYLTRTERALFRAHADDIMQEFVSPVTIAELGAGSAAKTGILLEAAIAQQGSVVYQPIDISPTALDEAALAIREHIPGVLLEPQVANYITDPFSLTRPERHRILALYIGSSIGNFAPEQATRILRNLRGHLHTGDSLLLGTDLAPGKHKSVDMLLAAYDDAAGVTAAFNKNILARLNRDLDADFNLDAFQHRARWNQAASRIEMHLESLVMQTVTIPTGRKPLRIEFAKGETIHTENSYKFSDAGLSELLTSASFTTLRTFHDPARSYAVTLARAV